MLAYGTLAEAVGTDEADSLLSDDPDALDDFDTATRADERAESDELKQRLVSDPSFASAFGGGGEIG